MKKLSSYIKIIFFISLIVSCSIASSREEKKFLLNQDLKTIKENWNGNPLDADGNFVNLEFPFKSTFYDFLKWQLQTNPDKEEKKNDTFKLKVLNAQNFADSNQDGICWLGHSTFIIRLDGITLITDPIFGTPAPLMKRLTRLPITPSKLKNIDYILISHDHYDHLHGESIKLLVQNNPDIKILTGLKTGEYMKDWLDGRIFQEAGWYQQYSITPDNLKITYLPTRHWSSRGMFGRNQRLWGAFMIQSENYTIYFGGDSGYGSHYKETSELFKNIDYAILGIGAYKPEWFMHSNHTSPKDALRAATELNAKKFIPMHYGTFDISDEAPGNPILTLWKAYDESDKSLNILDNPLGYVIKLDKNSINTTLK